MLGSKIRGTAAPLKTRLRRAMVLAAALAAVAAGAAAEEFHLFEAPAVAQDFMDLDGSGEPAFHLVDLEHGYPWIGGALPGLRIESAALFEARGFREPTLFLPASPPRPKKLFTTETTLVTAGTLLLGAAESFSAPIQYGWVGWNTMDEGWFGRNTYAGGADKASHFVVMSGISRTLYDIYTRQGHTVDQSSGLAFATAFMVGTFVEVLDGVSVYGFSFEDLAADALGSAAGVLIHRHHLQDLIGLRLGMANTDIPDADIGLSAEFLGASYSNEIYVADLKLGGLITRLHGKPGFARFFLTSFAFFTKGYGYTPPLPTRYQEIGLEVGLNFPEILKAVGVTEKTWWGAGLLAVFDFFRFPFTQVGVYYNLFDHKWYGPGAPYHFY
jgi:Predicted periplasmic lipoprotein (DUF2279)